MPRVRFCGVIEGSVSRRAGETNDDAIARAEQTILAVLTAHCKNLGPEGVTYGDGSKCGPNVGLESGT